MLIAEIKDFNALIDNKPFFDQPLKNQREVHGKIVEMSRNNDYKTGNLLDHSYHQNYNKLIGINLTNANIPQQINFIRKLDKDNGATMFFIAEKQLNFSLDSSNV